MGAVDVSAQVRAWALAEAGRQCFGEEFGLDIILTPGQTPAGIQVGYLVVMSCRAPLLGQGPLFSIAQLPTPQPTEEQVAQVVTETMRQLRMLSAQMIKDGKAAAN